VNQPARGSDPIRAVAFDFGGPVLLTPFELLPTAERRLGLPPEHRLAWHGPFDPEADPLWQQLVRGEITEREHWQRRAEEFGALARIGTDPRDLFGFLYDADPAALVRPAAERFLAAVRSAGLTTAVLTNDLARFHPAEWIASVPFLASIDVIVDGSVTGVLKPDPGAYRLLVESLGLPPAQVLFIDDQLHNVQAAEDYGLQVIQFDVTQPAASYRQAAGRLGLDPAGVGAPP
jgi:putative hydrolase of the HAD superfamily